MSRAEKKHVAKPKGEPQKEKMFLDATSTWDVLPWVLCAVLAVAVLVLALQKLKPESSTENRPDDAVNKAASARKGTMATREGALGEAKKRTLTLPLSARSGIDVRTRPPPPAESESRPTNEDYSENQAAIVGDKAARSMHRVQLRHAPPARFDNGTFPLRKERGAGDREEDE